MFFLAEVQTKQSQSEVETVLDPSFIFEPFALYLCNVVPSDFDHLLSDSNFEQGLRVHLILGFDGNTRVDHIAMLSHVISFVTW